MVHASAPPAAAHLPRHVREGAEVRQFDKIAEVQSDKATVDITSRFDGTIRKLHYGPGGLARVGAPLVDIEVEGEDATGSGGAAEHGVAAQIEAAPLQLAEEHRDSDTAAALALARLEPPPADDRHVKALPSVRKLAKELGISLAAVRPTGRQGQVTVEDLRGHAAAPAPPGTAAARTVPLTMFQKAMVRAMTESIRIPHFGFHDEIRMDRLLATRSELGTPGAGPKLTPLHFLIKALSRALLEFPQLNGHFDAAGERLTLLAAHNIGVAIDTGHGLAVPVLKDVQRLSVAQIAQELHRLADLARLNRLPPGDLAGATITISNIGTIGGTTASPIIPSPQLAIVALGKAQRVPRFDDAGRVLPVTLMPVSWAADHRVVDGATIARFSQRWKQLIEAPAALLLP